MITIDPFIIISMGRSWMNLQWLILAGCLMIVSLGCDAYRELEHSSCVFFMNYANDTCDSFMFDRCIWKQCVQYVKLDGSTYCIKSQYFKSYNWTLCTYKCCDQNVNYPETASSLQQCQDYLNSQQASSTLLIVILISVLLSLFCIGICVICYCLLSGKLKDQCENCCDCIVCPVLFLVKYCCCFICLICMKRSQPQENSQEHQTNAHIVNIRRKDIQNRDQCKVGWRREEQRNNRLSDVCSVCLDSKPSLQLQCGHIYHRVCIIQCMMRKQECILCRSKQFNNVRVYCQMCLNEYHETKLLDNLGHLKSQQPICDHCNLT